jgi:multisubunit Na+/H+ antiporter MnhE subunit
VTAQASVVRRWALWTLEAVGWWGLCMGVWVVSLSAVPTQEVVVGALVSLPCGVLAVMGRVAASSAWRFRLCWFRPLALVPIAIVCDVMRVFCMILPFGSGAGQFRNLPVAEASGDNSWGQGRRALATLLITSTPATIVTDIDPDTGRALLHAIDEGPSRLEEAVAS